MESVVARWRPAIEDEKPMRVIALIVLVMSFLSLGLASMSSVDNGGKIMLVGFAAAGIFAVMFWVRKGET